jgi:hypothetical protein
LHAQNADSVNIFQPYFWLIFDDPNVSKRLPEENAQITLHVADLPRGDGNVGLEEMMRGLGLHTTDNKDPHHPSPPSTKTDPSKNASDAPPEGYKAIDVRVERASTYLLSSCPSTLIHLLKSSLWSNQTDYGPREVLQRKRGFAFHLGEDIRTEFAKAWLAFDGFSSESARGPHTPNLFRAHEKWRKLAPPASARKNDDNNAATASETLSSSSQGIDVEEVEAGTESMTETRTNEISFREWVPIIPATSHSQQHRPRPKRDSAPPKNIHYEDTFNASTPTNPDNSPFNGVLATADATTDSTPTPTPTPTPMPAGMEETATKQAPAQAAGGKLSRRERILNLARQNARTPLPKLPEKPQPPPEAEKVNEESEREGKERTIRERLWRLVGANY